MKKKVLLLAVSCKTGGLCPGGLDLDKPSTWIRIVKNDGHAGAVQGYEIDFGQPLDIIEFEGRPMPQGKQIENWVIDNNSCVKIDSYGLNQTKEVLDWAYEKYSYNDFWGNYKAYLNEQEFNAINVPSESILRVSNVDIYKNNYKRWKIFQ
ncbi:MAG: dual OB domain-containing protein [Synechocystis sp.]